MVDRRQLVGPHGRRTALVITHVQNDFVIGSAAILGAGATIATANRLRSGVGYNLIVLVQDHHPVGHVSFLSRHIDMIDTKLYQPTVVAGSDKSVVMMPDHCLAGTSGVYAHEQLDQESEDAIIRVGQHKDVDAYSAFYDADRKNRTPLLDTLQKHVISDVHVCGLTESAYHTAIDAQQLGFNTFLVDDGVKLRESSTAPSWIPTLERSHVTLCHSSSLLTQATDDPRVLAAKYLDSHKIPQFFEFLCTELIYQQPADPRIFLVNTLRKMQKDKTDIRTFSTRSVFTAEDYESMFQMMDPLDKGVVLGKLVLQTLHEIGVDQKSLRQPVAPTQSFTLEQFKELLMPS